MRSGSTLTKANISEFVCGERLASVAQHRVLVRLIYRLLAGLRHHPRARGRGAVGEGRLQRVGHPWGAYTGEGAGASLIRDLVLFGSTVRA